MKRSGFTLMELLLVVAILAIVAAVAAPQFFRTSEVAMEDARVALLKANHSAIRAAINMAVWDDHNNPNIDTALRVVDDASTGDRTIIEKLIARGFLQESSAYCENRIGEKLKFQVSKSATTAQNPYDSTSSTPYVASAPIFMEQSNLFQITVGPTGNEVNIDDLLKTGKTWLSIWNDSVKGL